MITYKGMKFTGPGAFIIFEDSAESRVEIPIDLATANRISKYFSKFNLKIEEGAREENNI